MPVRFQMWFNDPVGQHMCSCMRLYGNEITMGMLVLSFVLYWVAVNISGWIPVATLFPEKAVVEIIWTLIPTIILTVMGFPSIILLFKTHEPVDPALSVKVIGHQWH